MRAVLFDRDGVIVDTAEFWRARERDVILDLDVDLLVSTADVDGPGKPAPDVHAVAAERVGAEPADCVAVEDSSNGMHAATRTGIPTAADPATLRAGLIELGALP